MTALTPSSDGALGRPVARRAGAVLLAGQHDQRDARGDVVLRGLEDAGDLAAGGEVAGDAALGAGRELVAQADVGERAADHDLVVAAARAVGVEVTLLDAVLGEVATGRAVLLDRTGRADVVGRDRVTELEQHPRAGDVRDRRRLVGHAVEVRRTADVGGALVPLERVALGRRQRLPALVAGEDVLVGVAEHLGVDRHGDRLLDLGAGSARCP